MKNNVLLMFLAATLLTGCSISDVLPWGNKTEEGSQEQDNKGEKESQEQSKEEEEQSKEDDQDQVPTGIVTKTINFYGNDLPSEWTDPGVSMDSTLLSCKTQNDRMVNLTKTQVGDNSLLSELFFKKLNTAYYDSSSLIVQIGTGNPAKNTFNPGTFIWTSVARIIKVKVTAACYFKTEGATDSAAHLTIEAGTKGTDKDYNRPITNSTTADMSFAVESGQTPEYKTYSYDYAEGIDRFCLTSLEGRVLLKSLTLTWWA